MALRTLQVLRCAGVGRREFPVVMDVATVRPVAYPL